MGQTTDTLRFSGDGSILFHGGYNSVRVWHNYQFVAECPGRLVGIAREGQNFLTYDKVSKSFSAWQSDTGTQIAVSTLKPADYAANQRYLIEANRLTLTFHDALRLKSSQTQIISSQNMGFVITGRCLPTGGCWRLPLLWTLEDTMPRGVSVLNGIRKERIRKSSNST